MGYLIRAGASTQQRLRAGLGQPVVEKSIVTATGKGIMEAAQFDPEPISHLVLTAVGAIVSLFGSLFGFGYDPKKLNDTAVTEAVQIKLHQLWYALTGEDLGGGGGGGCVCEPGQCGRQHCAIFTSSSYPNVPSGPAGYPGVDPAAITGAAQQYISQGQGALVRPESASDFQANTQYMLSLFNQVAQARSSSSPSSVVDTIGALVSSAFSSGSNLAPILIAGGAAAVLWELL